MNTIHPTAIVGSNTVLGENNYIGPYCVIDNCYIGNNNRFEAFCNIGTSPQQRGYEGNPGTQAIIGNGNVFREYTIVNNGTTGTTEIGNGNLIYAKTYIGHDSKIGNHVILSNSVDIAGHCVVKDYANLALGVKVHQFSIIPPGAFIGMGNTVTNADILRPFHKYAKVNRNVELCNTKFFISKGILTQKEIDEYTKDCVLNAHAKQG